MADWDVVQVEAVGYLRLAVSFKDGTRGAVRFEPSALFGVFEALKDPKIFDQVFIRDGAVSWPGELDLAPDAMHDEIQAHGEWVLR